MPINIESNFKAIEKLRDAKDWNAMKNIIVKSNRSYYQEYMKNLCDVRTNIRNIS